MRIKKEREELEKELARQKRKAGTIVDQNDIMTVVPPIPVDGINYPDPSIDKPKPKPIPDTPKPETTAPKPEVPIPKPEIVPSVPKTEDTDKGNQNKLDIPS